MLISSASVLSNGLRIFERHSPGCRAKAGFSEACVLVPDILVYPDEHETTKKEGMRSVPLSNTDARLIGSSTIKCT